jgi:parallel beta-helix repeat protein
MKTSLRCGALICAFFSSFTWRAAVLAKAFGVALCVGGFFILLPSAFPQGSLTPPGAPAPTMKSLDQIASTGIAINATNTPGDTNYEAVIFAAGGYYLTGNLDVAKVSGIHVMVAGVTIDLNGFQIDRASGSGGDGIRIDATAHRCTVKNGSITGFAYGIRSDSTATGGAFVGLAVSGCSSTGLLAGHGWRIEGCQAHDSGDGIVAVSRSAVANCSALNNGGAGISVGDSSTVANSAGNGNFTGISGGLGCTLTNCTAQGNAGSGIAAGSQCTFMNCSAAGNANFGIFASFNCALVNCTASANTSGASYSAGISVGDNCSLNNCTASNNATTNATHSPTTGGGFILGSYCSMQHCVASNNSGDGVSYVTDCFISGNNASHNGFDGFHTLGSINRVDSNVASSNSRDGFELGNDYVVRNSAFLNTAANYNPTTGGNYGPIEAASTSTHPWANF